MSEAQISTSMAASSGDTVRAAIARAATRTGADFNYLLAQARLESHLDPGAKASTSSAAGLYQFTRGTWLQTLGRHGQEHGLSWAGQAISGGRVNDPAMASQIMALRYDADTSALMAGELAQDNKAQLTGVLGREPDASELYLAHFLGMGGATTLLTALGSSPDASAAALVPQAASANRGIFYDKSGAARSVSGVMDLIRGRVDGAMAQDAGHAWVEYDAPAPASSPSAPQDAAASFAQSAPVRAFHAAQAEMSGGANRSMADVLRSTFGAQSGDGAQGVPDAVRNAYARLARFGL